MEIQLQQPQIVHLHFILIYQEKRIVVTFKKKRVSNSKRMTQIILFNIFNMSVKYNK